jgi:hypothetical protein
MKMLFDSIHETYLDLWLDWIKDELKLAGSEEERNYVESLFQKAVSDYLCIHTFKHINTTFIELFFLI